MSPALRSPTAADADLRGRAGPRRLPAYLQPPQLSVAEFAAARLDGEVFAFEDGFCSVDEPDTARLRAEVLRTIPALRHTVLAEFSAAWVHGATLLAPPTHVGFVSAERRSAVATRVRVRQVVLRDTDSERCGEMLVTTPTRTVADLARRTGAETGPALQAIRGYFLLGLTSPEQVAEWVGAVPRVLGRARILRVVATATDTVLPGLEAPQPPLTR